MTVIITLPQRKQIADADQNFYNYSYNHENYITKRVVGLLTEYPTLTDQQMFALIYHTITLVRGEIFHSPLPLAAHIMHIVGRYDFNSAVRPGREFLDAA